ncbi:cold-shock protein [Patescibacteria group bacterium]
MEGTIKVLKTGFGFLNVEGQDDVFFHANNLVNVEFDDLELDQTLSFEIEPGKNGKDQAVEVNLVQAEAQAA